MVAVKGLGNLKQVRLIVQRISHYTISYTCSSAKLRLNDKKDSVTAVQSILLSIANYSPSLVTDLYASEGITYK